MATANAGSDQSIAVDDSATLSGSGTGTAPLTYAWVKTVGPGSVTFTPSAAVAGPTADFSVPGTYVLQLTVTDAGAATASDTCVVSVSPAVVAGPHTGTVTSCAKRGSEIFYGIVVSGQTGAVQTIGGSVTITAV